MPSTGTGNEKEKPMKITRLNHSLFVVHRKVVIMSSHGTYAVEDCARKTIKQGVAHTLE